VLIVNPNGERSTACFLTCLADLLSACEAVTAGIGAGLLVPILHGNSPKLKPRAQGQLNPMQESFFPSWFVLSSNKSKEEMTVSFRVLSRAVLTIRFRIARENTITDTPLLSTQTWEGIYST
jgi:hypothetical protein